MAQKIFEEIKPWDGTSGTGAEARQVIKENFDKVNEAIGEIDNEKIEKTAVKQVPGTSTTALMSQKIISEMIEAIDLYTQQLDTYILALQNNKIDKTAIKQVDGSSTTDVMSQSAITNLYNQLSEAIQTLDQDLYQIVNGLQANKIDKSAIKQVYGNSETDLMSQKVISEMIEDIDLYTQQLDTYILALQNNKIDKTAIKQVAGNSETDLMSQKAVSSMHSVCNVSVDVPLAPGAFYTFETARAAVPVERRRPGLILLFITSDHIYQQYRFDASTTSVWESEEFWNSYNPQVGTGNSFTDYISQAGTTFLLNQKFDKTDVENADGNSQTKTVSQNHFTASKTNLQNQIDANSAAFNKHVNPSNIAINYPSKITYRNTAHKSISVTENGDILRSIQFVKDDPFQTSIKVKPDGQIQVQHVGTAKISVVPTQDPSLYQDIDIEVVLPSMREVGNVIRFTSTNAIRLT